MMMFKDLDKSTAAKILETFAWYRQMLKLDEEKQTRTKEEKPNER